jgi:hypothetical protein
MLRRLSTILITLTFGATVSLSQSLKPPKGSPDEVLDKYFKMINDGELLTPDGWKKSANLFVHPKPRAKDDSIFVTTKFPLGNGPMSVRGDQAEADEKWVDDLGTIDSALRYVPEPKPQFEVEGPMHIFHLVRTEKHGQILAGGISEKEVSGPPQWRIEGSPTIRWASREAAIRYLIAMRDKTADPAIKNNAVRTLARLKRLPAPRTHI